MPTLVPTGAALGADLAGVDFASDRDVPFVRAALRDHLVVRMRGCTLGDDVAFTRFARRFGELEGSPEYSRSRAGYVPDAPEVTVISNVVEDGVAVGEHGDGELNWHSDKGFVEQPTAYTFLIAREVPEGAGNTSFVDMHRALARLDATTRDAIESLRLKHQRSHTAQGVPRPGYRDIGTSDPRELPGPLHPIVRTHPESGRKALYLGRRFGGYIPSLSLSDSDALLDRLWSVCGLPEDVWTQRWRRHDLVIWDNRATMHRRDAFSGTGRRRMHRLTTVGESPV